MNDLPLRRSRPAANTCALQGEAGTASEIARNSTAAGLLGSICSSPAGYLALGDSYTIGEGIAAEGRWPVQLSGLLRERGLDLGDATTVARTGWTAGELLHGITVAGVLGPFELVTLQIGVNNQYRGQHVEDYHAELAALLQTAVGLTGSRPEHLIVLSIPDWSVTPFAIGRDLAAIAAGIEEFNVVTREETRRVGSSFVDITPRSRLAEEDSKLLAPDGLHPSATMYAKWARMVLPIVEKAFGRDSECR